MATTLLYVHYGNGSGTYTVGDYANISATPLAGEHFTQWGNAQNCTLVNYLASSTSVRLDASSLYYPAHVTAYYAADPPPPTYTHTYVAGAGGTISGTTPQTGASGTGGTQVIAVPNSGFRFISWGDGVATAARTDTIYGDVTYTANFASSLGMPVSVGTYIMF